MFTRKLYCCYFLYLLFMGFFVYAGGLPRDWVGVGQCRHKEGNVEFNVIWDGSSGVQLGLRLEKSGEEFRLEIGPAAVHLFAVPPIGIKEKAYTQLRKTGWNPGYAIKTKMPVLLKIRDEHWSIYLQDKLVAYWVSPGAPPLEILMPVAQQRRLRSAVRFYAVPKVNYTTDFMIENGVDDALYPWIPQTGKWGLHTVLEDALVRPETNLRKTEEKPLTPDKSPNFYSLNGFGHNAVIATGYDFYDNYRYAGAMDASFGEAGLVFYLRSKGNSMAYYAWTMRLERGQNGLGRMCLWRFVNGRRENLRIVELPVYALQWYHPAVKVANDRILCFLDDDLIIDYRGALPPGGKVGLFTDSEEEHRFDDISLHAENMQDLSDVRGIRFETLKHTGGFYTKKSLSDSKVLFAKAAKEHDASLFLGRRNQKNAVFSGKFTPRSKTWSAGICAGYTEDPDGSYYRMEIQHGSKQEHVRLCKVKAGNLLEELEVVKEDLTAEAVFTLCVDASEKGILRFLCNDKLVFLCRYEGNLIGAPGLWLGKYSEVAISELKLSRERRLFIEQKQKNPVFEEDNFMRHWASPEGQWIGNIKDMDMWHKGDFFHDFDLIMPWVDKSVLHLGIPSGQSSGKVQIKIEGHQMTAFFEEPEDSKKVEIRSVLPASEDISEVEYRIHYEGYLFWVEVKNNVLFMHRLHEPLRRLGTRVRVTGMTIKDLSRSQAYRKNVIDEFFYESPYNWQRIGGDWLIINRFQCTPSWSHMIGENVTGLAGLWRKELFKGDMTLEFYAGTRHEHYEQAGDLNCTIFASQPSASCGYTATATEWDHSFSQNWSRLYKKGKMLAQSDAYMVPRIANDMQRKFLNPLLHQGRPIHGAWFYIKLRKIGNKIEYYFDNELIYQVEDKEDVLQEGMVGIWTFIHSMTLAQIKISFDSVRPRKINFKEIPVKKESQPKEQPKPYIWTGSIGGFPLDILAESGWNVHDSVGESRLIQSAGNASELRYENLLGGGDMKLLLKETHGLKLSEIAGWEYRLNLYHNARINFLYHVTDGSGGKIKWSCFEQLNGADFTRGNVHWMGKTPVTDMAYTDAGQRMQVWIPHSLRSVVDPSKDDVHFTGFGSEQHDFLESGIDGNPPGAAYKISEFHPIFIGLPSITLPVGAAVYLRRPDQDRFCNSAYSGLTLSERLTMIGKVGLNRVYLLFRKDTHCLIQELVWIKLPEKPKYSLTYHPKYPDTLLLQGAPEYPDSRLTGLRLFVGQKNLSYQWEQGRKAPDFRSEQFQALVPLNEITGDFTVTTQLENTVLGKHVFLQAEKPVSSLVVLTGLDGFTPFFHTMHPENRNAFFGSGPHWKFYRDDILGESCLFVGENNKHSRLHTQFKCNFSKAQYPLLQYSYCADDMAKISLVFSNNQIRLSEADQKGSRTARYGGDWILDEKWHTWMGIYADGLTGRYERGTQFQFGSWDRFPQIGQYSWMSFARMVFGPAVRTDKQLKCLPKYTTSGRIMNVFYAVVSDPLPADLASLKNWQSVSGGEEIAPRIEALKDGVNWLCLYAVDSFGGKSEISHLPFLLDRNPLKGSMTIETTRDFNYNGTVLHFDASNDGLSPWDYERTEFLCNGMKMDLSDSSNIFSHTSEKDTLILNYPCVLKEVLNQSKDGDVFKITAHNIYDGAGNQAEDVSCELKIDYKKDNVAPQWERLLVGTNYLVTKNWNGNDGGTYFSAKARSRVAIHSAQDGNHYLISYAWHNRNIFTVQLNWNPMEYPMLAFRAKVPVYREDIKFLIQLTTNLKKNFTLTSRNLTHAGEPKIIGDSRNWQCFNYSIKKWLQKRKLSDEDLKKLRITSITFILQRTKNNEIFCLDDFYIYGDSGRNGYVEPRAYDASGLQGMEIVSVDAEEKKGVKKLVPVGEKINFQGLDAGIGLPSWVKVRLLDKAGNYSSYSWIPYFISALPK
ncbi:MAG: hypothetical protein WCS73_01075 [Lentisphaeria bacterium]